MFQLNLYAFLDRDADLMADALSGGVCMKKVNGLTNRTAAMLMSGMLIVGTVPGNVLPSELQADFGKTSEIASKVSEGTDT